MHQGWEDYEKEAERGPLHIGLKIAFAMIAFGAIIGTISYTLGWFSEAGQVAQEQFGPKATLEKYEWFKDAAAELDKKGADIAVYEGRLFELTKAYKDLPRQKWPREDREQYSTWSSEVAGIKSSFNSLAAEYNSGMAKFNWRFANSGELPKGASNPLPREFKQYISQ